MPIQTTTTAGVATTTDDDDAIAVVKKSTQERNNLSNGGDNIITISTISINNDCHTSHNQDDQLKVVSINPSSSTATGTVNECATASTNSPVDASSSSEGCCHLSRCVSFQENIADVHHRRGRRLHGLQLPLHPLQVLGWLVLILFGIASFCLLIPSFTNEIQGPLYGLITGLYIVHVVSHLAALLLDPADRELQRVHRNDRIVPEFDRSKHAHVIENGRCHLCNIRTSSPRTKHCSVCNKCVGKFDHHCKWLNHCIGSRNYVAFLMCVVSAVIATVVIVAAVIAQIVLYCVQPEWLSFWYVKQETTATADTTEALILVENTSALNASASNATLGLDLLATNATNITVFLLEHEFMFASNASLPTLTENFTTLIAESVNETLQLNLSSTATPIATTIAHNKTATIAGIGVSDTIFLALVSLVGLLAAVTAGLLLHLCFFHIYISFLGLTTYEYIRNHRQAQETKAKQALSNLPKDDQQQSHFPLTPSKKTKTDCGQMYLCSSVRHPNDINPTDMHYFDARKHPPKRDDDETRRRRLHCCVNSREYHQSAVKTYYMCSLLEESAVNSPLNIAHISGSASSRARTATLHDLHDPEPVDNAYKTFHCCSSFGALATQRRVSAATSKATLVSDVDALNARRSYLQFTEQCTLCTFRIRSPIMAKRANTTSATSSAGRTTSRQRNAAVVSQLSQTPKTASAASTKIVSSEHQRCCMKSISKHQRWRRKWNCCSNVPDSPDVPNDIIAALAMRQQHSATVNSGGKKINASELPVHFIRTVNGSHGSVTDNLNSSRPTSPRSANNKVQTHTRHTRTWPMPRLRHMMRMLGRYRRPRCRHGSGNSVAAVSIDEQLQQQQVKQNQIRPLQLRSHANGNGSGNGNGNGHGRGCQQHYNDSSSPQPPSTTTTGSSERSDQSIYSDSSALTTPSAQPTSIETILPTSVIRDDTAMTYTTPVGITLPPALPPPTRRKIPNPTNLEELAETLSFVSSHSSGSSGGGGGGGGMTLSPVQRLPALSNVYRRQRRKHFLRTRSPTLSPIHETGLSNPTSPQPGRHNANANASAGATGNSGSGSGEAIRKATSNSSLHSVSSNSSSS